MGDSPDGPWRALGPLPGPRGNARKRLPSFDSEAPSQGCQLPPQAPGRSLHSRERQLFRAASGLTGFPLREGSWILQSSTAALLPCCPAALKERRAWVGASLMCVYAVRNLERQEEKVFNFRSLFQSGVKKNCGISLGAPRTRGRLGFALQLPGSLLGETVARGGSCARSSEEFEGDRPVGGGRRRGGSFPAAVARSRADPGPRCKAQPRVSWLLLLFTGSARASSCSCGWAVRQQRLLVPRGLTRGTCLEKGHSPAQSAMKVY